MRKVLTVIIGFVVLGVLWYLFIKRGDYQVNFDAKANSGTVSQMVKLWSKALDNSEITDWDGLSTVSQRIKFNDSTHVYYWKLKPVHDSLTEVSVRVTDIDHSLQNRVSLLFSDTDFKKRTRKSILDFGQKLNEHLDNFRVTVEGVEDLGTTYCACVEVETTQYGKAEGMMKNYLFMSTVLVNNNIELNGVPFVEITHWDKEKDSIAYDFCYPIIRSERLPRIKTIKYKRLFDARVIKAEYNGNYITSDRAWYSLLNYADRNGYEVDGLPIEFFYNNPNMGGDELRWKAEVYLPIKD